MQAQGFRKCHYRKDVLENLRKKSNLMQAQRFRECHCRKGVIMKHEKRIQI